MSTVCSRVNLSSAPLVFSRTCTDSFDMAITSTLGIARLLNPSGWNASLNTTVMARKPSPNALPLRSRIGMPCQRALFTSTVTSASVSVLRAASTPGSAV